LDGGGKPRAIKQTNWRVRYNAGSKATRVRRTKRGEKKKDINREGLGASSNKKSKGTGFQEKKTPDKEAKEEKSSLKFTRAGRAQGKNLFVS